jgi:hypothetical protein
MRPFHRRLATVVAILAGLAWTWFDMKTYTGPESHAATLWRLGAFALMAGSALVAWPLRGGNGGDNQGSKASGQSFWSLVSRRDGRI